MPTFLKTYQAYHWEEVAASIMAKTDADVQRALRASFLSTEDFKALVSPAAEKYLEFMAQMSHKLTQKRFGKTIQMFIPLYVSNECKNICTYCGLSITNRIPRHTLSQKQILAEVKRLKEFGFDHILLVSGESSTAVDVSYLEDVIKSIRPYFSKISIEVQPLQQYEYERLIKAGLYAVYVYQETYHKSNYKKYHLAGQKADFENRILTPDNLGSANINTIGLGVLYGLENWRTESFFMALHLQYLRKQYWQTKYSISFPRIRPHAGSFQVKEVMTDKQLVQVLSAYRMFDHDVELSLSTREAPSFRDKLIQLGVTAMSAGSKTNPGGYVSEKDSLEQFQISDERSPVEISRMIKDQHYEPVWKDWDAVFQASL